MAQLGHELMTTARSALVRTDKAPDKAKWMARNEIFEASA
jgi:hypothetical protein